MSRRHHPSLLLRNGRERAEYGCTTTWKNADGKTLTVHRQGSPKAAFVAVAEDVIRFDDTFRLVSYSTPETIFRDVVMSDTRLAPTARTPESAMLSMVGMPHLLHPDTPRAITETFHRRSRH